MRKDREERGVGLVQKSCLRVGRGSGKGVSRNLKEVSTLDLINTAYLSALGDDYSRKIIQWEP